ncbi:MAG: pilus assembly protein PilM [Myxococcota bacterium]
MPLLKNILGLDLGSHSLKAVELRQTLRGIEAVSLHSLKRADPEISLSEFAESLVQAHGLSVENVVSAIPGDRISARRLEFPFSERRRLAQAVPFEVDADLPFDLDDFVVDWEVVGGDRARSEVIAAIVRRQEVSDLLGSLRAANCAPQILEAEGLVLANLFPVFDLEGVRLLVDLGHRKSTLCLLMDGRAAATRTIPVGGWALTEALAKDGGLAAEDAERAKIEERWLDAGAPSRLPETAVVLDRIGREIVRTVTSLEPLLAGSGSGTACEVTLFGGTAQLDGIDEYLAEHTGLATARLGLPKAGSDYAGLVAGGPPIVYAPAIALALRGSARARTGMNFRREEFAVRLDLGRLRRDFGWTARFAAVAMVLSLLSFATGNVLDSRRASAMEQEIQELYSAALPGQPVPSNALAGLRDAVHDANERAEFLGVYRGNLSALDVLAEISRRVPEDLDIVLEDLSIDRQTVRMRVHATSFEAADRLGTELATFAPFAHARIGAIETDRNSGGKRFNVTISLAPQDGPT